MTEGLADRSPERCRTKSLEVDWLGEGLMGKGRIWKDISPSVFEVSVWNMLSVIMYTYHTKYPQLCPYMRKWAGL